MMPADKRIVLGVDFGGSRIKYGLVDVTTRKLIGQVTKPTETRSMSDFIRDLDVTREELSRQSGIQPHEIGAIGIGLPGFILDDFVSLVWPALSFVEGDHFRGEVEAAMKAPVRVDNDARVAALGEYYYGSHDARRLLSLTLGTGVGFGFVVDGRFHEKNTYAHMAGHIPIRPGACDCYCGQSGCLESLVNPQRLIDMYLAERASEPSHEPATDAQTILTAAKNGQPAAQKVTAQMVQDLVTGLNAYVYQYAPDTFVLGGGLAEGLRPFQVSLQDGISASPYTGYQTRVVFSSLGEKAGALGAASLWMIDGFGGE